MGEATRELSYQPKTSGTSLAQGSRQPTQAKLGSSVLPIKEAWRPVGCAGEVVGPHKASRRVLETPLL